uniref:Uncharacterized protein n=1 Tax=Avena sativa TaxID=4498 RepID=A0ACD5UN92_AVESA
MDYMSPERGLDGTCGDPGPLFQDPDGSLLEHMDYHGEGITRHESPPLNDGLFVDPADQISYMSADSVPYINDQILGNTMKSSSNSPASPLKQDQEHQVYIESDDFEAQTTSPGYAVHQKTEVVDVVLPPELHERSGNGTSNFQQENTHSDAYLGDSMLNENNSRDYQFSNSGDDDDEIPNTSAPQMENKDNEKIHETFHSEVNGKEDDQMNDGNSDPRDEHDNENFNSAISPSYLDGMEQEDLGTENGISMPGNQWDSPPERSAGLEKGTPSPAKRVSLSVERSPQAHSSDKLDSPRHAQDDGNLARSRSPAARHRSRSLEKRDTNRRRASSHESSPHARDSSPSEKKAQSRRRDGSPRRKSASPRRIDKSPRRRSASPRRRDGSPQRRSASPKRRDDSPHRRSASPKRRHGSPRRRSPSPKRRHGSPRRRSPSPKRRHGSPRRRSPSPKRRHGSPRRRSPSPKRRASPKRRGSPRRRDSPSRRRDSPPRRRDSSPRRNSSPRKRDSSPRRRDSPTRKRDRSKSRSPSRKTDSSRHRREHGRSRSRSPHSRDHHKRSPRRRHSPRHRSPPASHRQHSPKRPWSPPANRKTGLGKPGKNLFVAGFSYATTERELEKKFTKFGRVTRVRVVRDKRTGDSRGFGFLSLEKDEDADAAIKACDETEWNGRIILVEKSKSPAL